jgi:MFS family permease
MSKSRFPALSHRDFLIFWVGQFLSLIGTWMQSTIQPYLAYKLTGQPIYLGLIGFAGSLPALLLMLPGGVLVERVDKRKAVIVLQAIMMAQAFVMAWLTLTGRITIWHIILLSLLLGVAGAFETTARQSMLVDLVDKEALPNAIALNSTIFNLARVVGPSLTAPFLILLKTSGEGWAFFANGVSYLFVIIGLLFIARRSQARVTPPGSSFLEDFKDGQRYIFSTPGVAILILMVMVPSFVAWPALQQIPVFARDILKTAAVESDALVATRNSLLVTGQGVGALIAALVLALFSSIHNKGRLMMVGQYIFCIGMLGLGFSHSMVLSFISLVLIGWGTVTHLAITNTLIQLSVPDELRGRVVGTYFWALSGTAPFGSLLMGWLAQTQGAPFAVLAGSGLTLLAYLGFHTFRPAIRQISV